MAKKYSKLLEENTVLNKKNKVLQDELRVARKSINAIKTGNIDALVIANKKAIKVYTEKSADKIYRILIEKMNEGAVTLNESGTILYCNSYFADMVKLPLEKVIGAKFRSFVGSSSKDSFDAMFNQGKLKTKKEEIFIFANGFRPIPVLMSVNTLSLDNNFVVSIILTDLTIQKKTQDELKERTSQLEQKNIELESANKDLTSFTYVSSHDLQEPLRKIQTFANLIILEEQEKLSENGKHYFHRMQNAAERMQTLIQDLLTYSQAKTTDGNFKKTNLAVIVDEVKKDFELVINDKKVSIEAFHLCDVNIIPFQFRQLMHNLISNSLKFSYPEKQIRIIIKSKIKNGSELNNKKLSTKMNYCHITYVDNGIGFDPKYKHRIFEVFQRLHGKEVYPGTGMGLAICQRVVENHQGVLTATGKLNKGARFDIYIPAN